ncbi:glycosyl transferase, family 2 [Fimbriiglobus ruber]|uniref:Glycosyl transferase, family 2 n=1 Tax=Fimbriiglobus ruber TaxID=1908690 RepID=A0A225DYS9_9BACT|nr:glycosyl transferase, family 2 [Fimbriiglobus ruber]
MFPAYNPGPAVEQTWLAAREFLRAQPSPWEILFVCDGCTDGTQERLEKLGATTGESRIRVVGYAPNRGKGYAVRYGLLAARGRWRVFTDVDLAYRFEDVVRLADELRAGADVAIASREHPDSVIQLPPRHLAYAYRRRLQSKVFGKVARTILPLTQLDTQAGLKGMSASVAEQLLPSLTCSGFGFDCELLTACARYNIAVTEVPVCVRYEDTASTTGMGSTVRMLREIWQIRRVWRKNGFPPPARVGADSLPGIPADHGDPGHSKAA